MLAKRSMEAILYLLSDDLISHVPIPIFSIVFKQCSSAHPQSSQNLSFKLITNMYRKSIEEGNIDVTIDVFQTSFINYYPIINYSIIYYLKLKTFINCGLYCSCPYYFITKFNRITLFTLLGKYTYLRNRNHLFDHYVLSC